jgi:hypothetical protein
VQRLALITVGCLLTLGPLACGDKQAGDGKAGDAKQADETKPDDGKKADDKPADADVEPADDKPAADDGEPGEDVYVDDTKGIGGIVREIAGVDTPADTSGATDRPRYDTSVDAGGLIGHLASGLAHNEDLGSAETTKTLGKLAGIPEDSPTDATLCKHVWTEIVAEAYPSLAADAETKFIHDCRLEVEKERVKLGVEIFAQHAACVLAAKDLAALDLCDAAEQEAEDFLHANPHGDRPEHKLCVAAVDHIFFLIGRDIGTDVDTLELLQENIDAIKADAVLACRDEATSAELSCVLKAPDLAGLESCE